MLVDRGLPCNDCGSSDALAIYEENTYCFSCHKSTPLKQKRTAKTTIRTDEIKLPETFTSEIPDQYRAWLYRYGISDNLIQLYNIGFAENVEIWSQRTNRSFSAGDRLILPIYRGKELLAWEGRSLDPEQLKYVGVGGKKDLFYSKRGTTPYVVVVEDILSCIRVGEVASTIALRGTSCNNDKLYELSKIEADYLILWLDGDEAGRRAAIKLQEKLKWFQDVRIIMSDQDPKGYTYQTIQEFTEWARDNG